MSDDRSNSQAFFGLSDLIIWCRRHWVLIIAPVALCFVLGAIYALVATPKYRSEALLAAQVSATSNQVLNQLGNQLGAIGLGGMRGPDNGSQADIHVAILRSRQFLSKFIDAHALLPTLFASRWDEEFGGWVDDGEPPPSLNDGYRKFRQNLLAVSKDEITGLITVAIEWNDPQLAHDWLAALIADLNESVRQRERDQATKSLEFLKAELQRTEIMELQQALNQLSLAELQKLTLANVREEFAFRVIDAPSLADDDDPVWPKPVLIILGSMFLGLFAGLFLAVVLTAWRASGDRA
jgi:uncharacterized protein involved in exopolysaccharide biosynthesis